MSGHTGRKTIPEAADSIGCRVSFIGSYIRNVGECLFDSTRPVEV
jgi:hypothetical protein